MKHGKIRNNPVEMNQSSGVGDPLPDLPSLLREADNKVIVNLTKKGWVLLHRRFWDDEDFPAEPFTELQAWAWLFSEACYEDKHVHFQNRAIPLKRGQLATTIRILAKRFKWGRVKADSFLRKLEKFGKILRQPKDRDYTIVTICKYNTYQIPQDNEKTTDRPTQRQPKDNPPPRLKKIKEKKEKTSSSASKKPPTEHSSFVKWWCEEYKNRFQTPYNFSAKDAKLIQGLLKSYKSDLLRQYAKRYWDTEDEFYEKNGYSIGIFNMKINAVAIDVSGSGFTKKNDGRWKPGQPTMEEW